MMTENSAKRAVLGSSFLDLQIQCVLYNLQLASIERALSYIEAATAYVRKHGWIRSVKVSYGDCSPAPTLDNAALERLRRAFPGISSIDYTYFNANLGSAAGHNRLLAGAKSDLVMILNPDVLVAPDLLVELTDALSGEQVGFVEARQLPVEHPKDYDRANGETSWGSTACLLGATQLFHALDGFDSNTFFLYCDDVDLCWRARLQGWKIIHRPNAVVYHDKRLTNSGGWIATAAEAYYSAEASLLLTYKYSRPDLTERYLSDFRASGNANLVKAASAFTLRKSTNRLPACLDPEHRVADFVDDHYGRHRFQAR